MPNDQFFSLGTRLNKLVFSRSRKLAGDNSGASNVICTSLSRTSLDTLAIRYTSGLITAISASVNLWPATQSMKLGSFFSRANSIETSKARPGSISTMFEIDCITHGTCSSVNISKLLSGEKVMLFSPNIAQSAFRRSSTVLVLNRSFLS